MTLPEPRTSMTLARTPFFDETNNRARAATSEECLAIPEQIVDMGVDILRLQAFETPSITIPDFKHPSFDLGTPGNPNYLHQIYDGLATNYMRDPAFHKSMKDACHGVGILYAVSLYDIKDAEAILPAVNPDYVYVDQNEAGNDQLLQYLADCPGVSLVINVSTSNEIRIAKIDALLDKVAPENIILNYGACGVSGGQKTAAPSDSFYPDVIEDMARKFKLAVGHADQTPGIYASLVAASKGAVLLDKVTTMRRGASPTPTQAVTLDEFQQMVELSKYIVDGRKTAPAYGRSGVVYPDTPGCPIPNNVFPVAYVAQKDIAAGEKLNADGAIAGKRIAPTWQNAVMGPQLSALTGRVAAVAIAQNTIIEYSHIAP